ncbi:glucosyltransferase domain-containing protein, partial [Salmonella enterica subsp. enterica serovar Alachua]|nr:glucosyltransferase domain-containing protein [Salmonella enterica subsp. enterica serovar Alachua]
MNNIKLSHFILVSVFLSIPVVLLNTYYADDLYRSALATYGWESDGRLFSLALYYIISVGGSLSDLYPFSQMTAYALLGITAYIVSSRIIEDKSIIGLIITLPIITSPLLLGNLLYRFDALTMMSGVLCATAPFAFRVASKRVLFIYSPILLLSSLSFYQASSIAFVSLSAMEFFKSTMKDESLSKSFLRLSYRASALFGGFIGFKVINSIFVVKNDYTEQLSKLVSLDKNAPEKIIDTFIKSMDLIYMFSKGGIGKIIFIFLIAVTISCLIIIFRKATHSAMGSLTRTLVGVIVSLIISFLCIPGFILLANTPVFYPRLYIGFGFFFVFGGYVVHYAIKNKRCLYILIVLPLAFTSINLSTINAIRNQDHNNFVFS